MGLSVLKHRQASSPWRATMTTPFLSSIPEGFCQCGCGGATEIAKCDSPKYGYRAGSPRAFIDNHHRIKPRADLCVAIIDGISYARIPLTQGLFSLVDLDNADSVMQFRWFAIKKPDVVKKYYARTTGISGLRKHETLHRFLMRPPKGMVVDHINGDGLDNRRINLRICTPRNNTRNRSANISKLGFKGVNAVSGKPGKFYAVLHLGVFDSRSAAAKAYDDASLLVFPEFTRLNQKRD